MTLEQHASSADEATRQAMSSLTATGFDVRRIYASTPRLCRVTGHPYDCWAYTVTAEGEQLTESELRAMDGNR